MTIKLSCKLLFIISALVSASIFTTAQTNKTTQSGNKNNDQSDKQIPTAKPIIMGPNYNASQPTQMEASVLVPEGLSNKFFPGLGEYNDPFFTGGLIRDPVERMAQVRKEYGEKAEDLFIKATTKYILPIIALSLMLGYFIAKGRSRTKSAYASTLLLTGAILLASYITFGWYGGNFEDLKLYINYTLTIGIIGIVGVLLSQGLFLKLLSVNNRLNKRERIILFSTILLIAAIVTYYLSNKTLEDNYSSDDSILTSNPWNWISFVIVSGLLSFILFKKLEKDKIE